MTTIEIRNYAEGDLEEVEALYRQAFPEEDLAPLLRALLPHPAMTLSLVATQEEVIHGHIVFTACRMEGSSLKLALLGPLAVSSARQRQGVGSALVREGLRRLEGAALAAHVLVLGDPRFYARFGFEREDNIETPYPTPAEWKEAWRSLPLADAGAAPQGVLITPPPWSHKALWAP